MADPKVKGRIWLCVEKHSDGSIRVHGDSGRGGLADPFKPGLCEFGGWRNHTEACGWYRIGGEG